MYSEARKLRLIGDLIKLQDEVALMEIETLVKNDIQSQEAPKSSTYDLVGLWSKEDAEAIERAIDEGCE
jgi:hypothetical protein